jgi:hypothetical protein
MSRTLKPVAMDCSMPIREMFNQVKATEVVIMTELTMIQTAICPMLTTIEVSLQVHVRTCPPDEENARPVSRDMVIQN